MAVKDISARFWSKVDKRTPSECWPWAASRNGFGYGMFGITRERGTTKIYKAHRVAYELTRGTIPDGQCVCHTCDRPPCCNPAHLFLASHRDNMHDRDRKGRNGRQKVNGEQKLIPNYRDDMPNRYRKGHDGRRKVTDEQKLGIIAMYGHGMPRDAIATRLHLDWHTIDHIVRATH
jgi:hypothetical protein